MFTVLHTTVENQDIEIEGNDDFNLLPNLGFTSQEYTNETLIKINLMTGEYEEIMSMEGHTIGVDGNVIVYIEYDLPDIDSENYADYPIKQLLYSSHYMLILMKLKNYLQILI